MKKGMKYGLGIVGLLVLGGIVTLIAASVWLSRTVVESPEVQQFTNHLLNETAENPKYADYFQSTESDTAKSALVNSTISRGLGHLPTDTLVQRAELLHEMADYLKDGLCFRLLAHGDQTAFAVGIIFLDGGTKDRLVDVSVEAFDLGVNNSAAASPPSEDAMKPAIDAMMSQLSERERSRLAKALSAVFLDKPISDSDGCQALKKMYRLGLELPESEREALFRTLLFAYKN